MKAQVGTCAWGIPSKKCGMETSEILEGGGKLLWRVSFGGPSKALEGQRQTAEREGVREGLEVHCHPLGAWLCAQHLVYIINPHYNPLKSVLSLLFYR